MTPTVAQPVQKKSEKILKKDSKGNEIEMYVPSDFEKMVYQKKVKAWIKEEVTLNLTTQSLYNIVWGQCSKLMKDKITMVKNFTTMET